MTILCDIGGTHARFALSRAPGEIGKYVAADFKTFEEALASFCGSRGVKGQPPLRIATAAFPEGTAWRFVNRNPWIIDIAKLGASGWNVEFILNDFEAALWGLPGLAEKEKEILKHGAPDSACPQVLIGPGTGLGLGYLVPTAGGPHVQRTHGGHMAAAALTDDQALVITLVRRMLEGGRIVAYENLVSGPGLFNIYRALCLVAGVKPRAQTAETLFDHLDEPLAADAVRLFHEFFGLFAQNVVVGGHAYGGLCLTGGVLDRLAGLGRFDFAAFEKFFILPVVESAHKGLQNTPVIRILHPDLALRGLLNHPA